MRNLLNIERQMLDSARGFNLLGELTDLAQMVNTAQSEKLLGKIQQGKLAIECKKWLKKPQTTRIFEEFDLEKWSIEEMSLKFFSVRQSQMNRMIKAYKHTQEDVEVLTAFMNKCTEEEESGKKVSRSIDNFNKYVKGLNTDSTEEVSATIPTIFTLAFKIKEVEQNAERNIAVRIDENLTLTSKNEQDEIVKAMQFLASKLAGVSVLTGVDTDNFNNNSI